MTEPVITRPLGAPGDLGWVVMAQGELYAEEFGWNTDFEALVARIVSDYADHRRPDENAWIAVRDGWRQCCIFCMAPRDVEGRVIDSDVAQLRILLVHPDARGSGLGGRLVDTCLDFARSAGKRRVELWTNDPLVHARQIYLSRGFVLASEEPHRSFGVDLVGQTYALDL
jgi:GNAT superfamily N-acetyltransferase